MEKSECALNGEEVEQLGGVCPDCGRTPNEHKPHPDPNRSETLAAYDARCRKLIRRREAAGYPPSRGQGGF